MRELKVRIADPIGESAPTSVTIKIENSLPLLQPSFGTDVEEIYNEDAESLAWALFYSLPQGTFDRLIIKLMKRKVNLYRGLTRS